MKGRIVAFVALALALAAFCVRLGVWQVERLRERRAYNADLEARLALPPVPIEQLGREDRMRRAWVEGTPDYEREFVQSGRSMNGSPGVYIFTPVRLNGADRAVLVNRGWVYAPDAATVDLSRWREQRTRFSGYTAAPAVEAAGATPKGRSTRVLGTVAIASLVTYPTEFLYLISRDSGGPGAPARLPEIQLTDGPHLSYAIQWFCFAAIAFIGAGVVVHRSRRSGRDGSTAA